MLRIAVVKMRLSLSLLLRSRASALVDEVVVAKISMFFVLLQMMAVGSSCKFLIVV